MVSNPLMNIDDEVGFPDQSIGSKKLLPPARLHSKSHPVSRQRWSVEGVRRQDLWWFLVARETPGKS